MSQISPPIRILLVCTLAFMAAWMLFLRPKDDAGTPAAANPTPPASRPVDAGGQRSESLAGKAVEKANEAGAAQDARAEQLAGTTGESAATPADSAVAPATAGQPATAAGERAGFLAARLDRRGRRRGNGRLGGRGAGVGGGPQEEHPGGHEGHRADEEDPDGRRDL